MVDFCKEAPDRLWGQAFIGLWDIDYAIREMQRAKDGGLKGVATWIAPPDELPFTGDHYERFWSAAEEMDMPIGWHINTGFGAYVTRADEDRFGVITRQAYGHKVVAMKAIAEMILSGVLQRHPRLKIVLSEFEVGWIPSTSKTSTGSWAEAGTWGSTCSPANTSAGRCTRRSCRTGSGAICSSGGAPTTSSTRTITRTGAVSGPTRTTRSNSP